MADTGYRYLLDSNILLALIREPVGQVQQRIRQVGEEALCTSIIAVAEARFDISKSGSQHRAESLDAILSALPVLPLDLSADRYYADIRLHNIRIHSEQRKLAMDSNDMLIAAHALACGLTVVTDDVSQFSSVPGLAAENWLSPSA